VFEVGDEVGVFFYEGAEGGAAGEEFQPDGATARKEVYDGFTRQGGTGFQAIEESLSGSFREGTGLWSTYKGDRATPPFTPQNPHRGPKKSIIKHLQH